MLVNANIKMVDAHIKFIFGNKVLIEGSSVVNGDHAYTLASEAGAEG